MTGCDNNCGNNCGSCSNCNNCRRKCKCKKRKCYYPVCPKPKCDSYFAEEVCCKLRGAVVDITSQLMLTTDPPVDFNQDTSPLTVINFRSNGVFIKCGKCLYVLCSSAAILAPPAYLVNNLRYPFVNANAAITGLVPDDLVQMSKILVTVHNLDGKPVISDDCEAAGHTIVYQARVCFVDGAGGFGLLQIDGCSEWNKCLPEISAKHQPHIKRGKSRHLQCGEKVFLLGNIGTNIYDTQLDSSFGISQGVVINERGADPSGWNLQELVIVDAQGFSPNIGMPIIDGAGRLVGLQTLSVPGVVPANNAGIVGNGMVAGISQEFMEYPLNVYCRTCQNKCKSKYRQKIREVQDNIGYFCAYVKGYAGLAYQVTTASDYNTIVGDLATGARVPLFDSNGNLYSGPNCKYLRGITVITLAGNVDITYALVPGAAALAPYNQEDLNDSNFLNEVPPGAIILGQDGCDKCWFGNDNQTIVPALYTWKTVPATDGNCGCCDTFAFEMIVIPYEGRTVPAGSDCIRSVCVESKMLTFPAIVDYPWGIVNQFPIEAAPGALPVVGSLLPSDDFYPSF